MPEEFDFDDVVQDAPPPADPDLQAKDGPEAEVAEWSESLKPPTEELLNKLNSKDLRHYELTGELPKEPQWQHLDATVPRAQDQLKHLTPEQLRTYDETGRLPPPEEKQPAPEPTTDNGEVDEAKHQQAFETLGTRLSTEGFKDPNFPELVERAHQVMVPPESLVYFAHALADLPDSKAIEAMRYLTDHPSYTDALAKSHPAVIFNAMTNLPIGEKAQPYRRLTKAPRPPAEVSARGTAPADEALEAVKDRDFLAYERIENAKDTSGGRRRR